MPISLLKNIVVDNLASIGFKRPGKNFSRSVSGCLKEVILYSGGVDITVLNDSSFRVNIQAERYYESLVSDFYFSLQKVTRQRESLDLMLENDTPGAWILVTAYYHAFYAAVEISRLSGSYNMSIDASHLDRLNSLSESTARLAKHGAYLGRASLDLDANSIVINFSKNGFKPHYLAWSNISGKLNNQNISKYASGRQLSRVALFKEIVGQQSKVFPTPSALRNKWNYSLVNSYDKSSDIKANKLKYILKDQEFNRAKLWCDKKIGPTDEDAMASLGYVCIILENVMKNISSRLIDDFN